MGQSYTPAQQRRALEEMLDSDIYRSIAEQDPSYNLTQEREQEIVMNLFEVAPKIQRKKQQAYVERQMLNYYKEQVSEGVLITICIDQKQSEEEAVMTQYKVLEHIRRAKYKWLVEPRAVFEYWGKTFNSDEDEDEFHTNSMESMPDTQQVSGNFKFNPHIHLCVKRIGKESVIRQNLLRKFLTEKKVSGVYRIDVKKMDYGKAVDYVSGVKCEAKAEQVLMDEETREKHQVSHIIIL